MTTSKRNYLQDDHFKQQLATILLGMILRSNHITLVHGKLSHIF